MKRVCILSMQKVNNYGSLLQAYSLKKILEGMGVHVSFVDIERRKIDNDMRGNERHTFEHETKNSLLKKFGKVDAYLLNRIGAKFANKKQFRMYEDFRLSSLKITSDMNTQYYDLCVIGSDEVFNCMSNSDWGFTSQLFGNVYQAKDVITYAASCGATKVSELPEKVREKIRESFYRISAFSVRDENTKEFVSAITGKQPEIYFDPVLVGDFEIEIENAVLPNNLPKKFCIVYSYSNRIKDKEEIHTIKKICIEHGLKVISMGAPQYWIENHIACTPFQMLKVFVNADFVVTDTFHGTIFSARYAKRFAVIVRDSNRNKLSDLINRLGIQEHYVKKTSALEEVYFVLKDSDKINNLLSIQSKRTKEYLIRCVHN